MALLARLCFNYGPVEQPLVPTNQGLARTQVAKVWLRKGKSMIQGTAAAVAAGVVEEENEKTAVPSAVSETPKKTGQVA